MENTSPTWTREAAQAVYDLPLMDLLFRAQTVHRDGWSIAESAATRSVTPLGDWMQLRASRPSAER